jgi:hypothetical protein
MQNIGKKGARDMTRLLNLLLVWLSFFVVCSLIQSCNSPVSPTTSTFDVFPLSKGLSFKYLYTSFHSQYYTGSIARWTDSGTVEYLIQDSVNLSSTLRLWIFSENANLLHQYYSPTGQLSQDSSYWNKHVVIDSLYEVLSNSQIVGCKSLIWNFPISNINALWSPFSFSRYCPASYFELTYESPTLDLGLSLSCTTNIQVIFAKDTGLVSASYASTWSGEGGVESGGSGSQANLLTSSVAP